MIPISLTLQGLYSYKNKVNIDFKNLTSAHLFGIFGPVGCGKSSILEAISFALYGEIERLNIKDNRNYNIMNLCSDSIFIEFTFSAGTEQNEYKFTVNGKRNAKHFEKVEKLERNAYKKDRDQWIPLEDTTAEKIIGLSYENFRRAIIIPQGKFNDFLNLGNAERTQMLKEIFHLEKFELSGKTIHLKIKNEKEIENLNGMLSQIKDISEETITEKEVELKKLKQHANLLTDKSIEKEKTNNSLNLLKSLFEKHQENKTTYQELSAKEKEYLIKEERLNKYETCVNNFKDILSQKNEREKRIINHENELTEKSSTLKKLENELSTKKEYFNKIKESFNNKETLLFRNQELNKIIEIKKIESQIPSISEEYNIYSKNVKEHEEQLIILKNQKQKILKEINSYKKNLPNVSILPEIKLWFEQKKEKDNSIIKITEDFNNKINDKFFLKNGILNKIIEKKSNINEFSKILNEEKSKIQEQSLQLKNKFNEFQLSQKLYNFTHDIKDGVPCPLCGSKEHPNPLKIENVEDKIEKIKKEIINIEDYFDKIEKVQLLIEKLNEEEKLLKKHLSIFNWDNYSLTDEEKINVDFNNLQKINNEINNLNNDLENIDKEIENIQNQKDNIDKELREIEKQLLLFKTKKNGFLDQLKILIYNEHKTLSEEELYNKINETDNLIKNIELEYNKSQNSIKKIENEEKEKQGETNKIKENIVDEKKLLEEDIKEINNRIIKFNFNSLDEVQKILNNNEDLVKEKNDIFDFKKALHSAKENFEKSKLEIQDKKYDEDKHKSIEEDLLLLKTNITTLNQKIGGFVNSLKEMKSDLKKKNKFEKELEKLKERADNISVLLKLFRGSGFVNYISSIYLNNLCNSANERFYKLTRQNLKLEIKNDNSLQIRDFLNNGQTRSVKTLSGGQSFQVSLSLALSLAENISLNAGALQNFFFIDEGFGSLDRESLQLVFNTLKSLKKENRIVGVISHLEDLRQEIDVYLEVENDPEEGSKIKSSLE